MQLLLRAASRLQAVHDEWNGERPATLEQALHYNRKLWMIFLTSVTSNENPLPREIKQNVANLANFIIKHSMNLESDTAHAPKRIGVLININREIAAGLRARAA